MYLKAPTTLGLALIAACSSAPLNMDVDSDEPLNQAPQRAQPKQPQASEVRLKGRIFRVRWGDGDTFSFKTLSGKRKNARLAGFNALESYGPVHRWGQWTPQELYGLAKKAGTVAAAQGWVCKQLPGGGGYGRLLVSCPELKKALLRQGLAHVFSIDGPGDAPSMSLQHDAQSQGQGFWAKGVPDGLVTSLHSRDERPENDTAYDRVVSTKTGHAPTLEHAKSYGTCDEVCHQGSCMVYVPYRERYGKKRPSCLR
jgi:micrococcal nuclease